jgi:hypothetical protein
MTDWGSFFDWVSRDPGASSEALLALAATLFAPITEAEREHTIRDQCNPWPPTHDQHALWRPIDPATWVLPEGPLPASYLGLLAWSDGCGATNGKREFGFLGTKSLREYMLCYHFPEYMPGSVPFALDGGGIFYVFDMREAARGGRVPSSRGSFRQSRL